MIEEHFRAHLTAASLGVNIYCGPVRIADPPAMPHKAIFILETGGPPPVPYMDGVATSWRTIRTQIRLRGEPNSYASTRDLAQSIWSACQQGTVTGGYVRVTCEQSAPLYMGLDDKQCPEYSINVMAEKRA